MVSWQTAVCATDDTRSSCTQLLLTLSSLCSLGKQHLTQQPLQKNILGLVQGPPCRIDVDFKDEKGRRYHKTAVVKGKNGETEELPLYTNHDNIFGEVIEGQALLL